MLADHLRKQSRRKKEKRTKIVFSCSMQDLKDKVEGWEAVHPKARSQNEGYYGVGVLVPVKEVFNLSNYQVKLEA